MTKKKTVYFIIIWLLIETNIAVNINRSFPGPPPKAQNTDRFFNPFYYWHSHLIEDDYPLWSTKEKVSLYPNPNIINDNNFFYPVWCIGYGYLMYKHAQSPCFNLYFSLGTEDRVNDTFLKKYVSNAKKVLWIRTGSHKNQYNDISTFASCCLDDLKEPVILITSDGDTSIPTQLMPGTYEKIMNSPKIIAWYTQNYDLNDNNPYKNKLLPIPIGIDLHVNTLSTQEKLDKLIKAREQASIFQNKKRKILLDATFISNIERFKIKELLKNTPHVDIMEERLSFFDAMERYASYRFVISPPGNGIDCHRTWELLALGVIPIVIKSSLTLLYKKLPIVVVNDWNLLKDPKYLDLWSEQYHKDIISSPVNFLDIKRWLPQELF